MSSRACISLPSSLTPSSPKTSHSFSSSPWRWNAHHRGGRMFLCLAVAALFLSQDGRGIDPGSRRARIAGVSSNDVIPGVVVIKFKRSFSVPDGPVARAGSPLLTAFSERGVTSLARACPLAKTLRDADVAAGKVDLSQIHIGTIPPGLNPAEVAARIAELPQVQYAEPKYYSHLAGIPNDSDYVSTQQTYFDRMNIPAAWALRKGSAAVVIATVDGGTNWKHPDLKDNIWVNPGEDLNHDGIYQQYAAPAGDLNVIDDDNNHYVDDVIGWNFTYNTNDPRGTLPGSANHGTQTASIFGAVTDNGRGMAGTSWNCRIMPVCAADSAIDLLITYGYDGIAYAALMGASVINCSWHRRGDAGTFSQFEQDVITAATQAGALVVAAAGNSKLNNDDTPFYPASYDHVLSVGATEDTSDAIAYFSDYGLSVSAFAPGMRIRVALDNGSYGTDQGTSDASPIVAGLAGLLKSAHPDWRPEQIAEQVRMTSDPIDASNPALAGSLGHGRVNFYRALSEAHSGITLDSGRFHTRSDGTTVFTTGDTVILTIRLKNVLTLAAENLLFSVSSDPALNLLPPIVGPTRLDPGTGDSVTIAFLVSDLARGEPVSVRVRWNANADESDARLFKTTVYARTGYWARQTSPTTAELHCVHAVDDRVVWATGFTPFSSPAVLRTTDGGNNWAIVTGNLSNIAPVCISATDSLHAWVGTYGISGPGAIFATVDGGITWTQQAYPSPLSPFFDGIWFFDAANGYAIGDPQGTTGKFVLLRTTDGGSTWNHMANEPYAGGSTGFSNAFWCTDRQHIWFGTTNSFVYRSIDGGDTWSSTKVGSDWVTAVAMKDDSTGIACSATDVIPPHLSYERTTDGGATWQMLPEVKPEGGYAAAFPGGSTDVWVSGAHTVAWSHDNGTTWALERTDPFAGWLWAISFSDPAHGWITTNKGEIFRRQNPVQSPTALIERENRVPTQAVLEQNYPNPFNPGTTIQFALPHHANVSLLVFNTLGQHVATLIQGEEEAGYHQVKFDAASLASGVYFYQLRAGGYVTTKKLLHVK